MPLPLRAIAEPQTHGVRGKFDREVVPVNVPQRRGDDLVVSRDEEYTNVRLDKIPTLRPAFDKEGPSLLPMHQH